MSKQLIDETFIDLNIKGGNLHTELIQIEAKFNKGLLKNQSVPLKCQWFNITKDHDFIEIDEVVGQFYQPCILDIDTKIMVQAIPILDQEYNGMPLVIETNYLQADSKIFDLVNNSFKEGKFQQNCKLENIQQDINKDQLPNLPFSCNLLVSEEGLQLKNEQSKFSLLLTKYEIKIIKKNNNQIEVLSDNSKLILSVINNIIRDTLFQLSKTFKAKTTILHDTPQLYAKITDQEEKLILQEKEIQNLQEQKNNQKTTINELQSQILQQQKKIEQYEKQSQNLIQQNQNKEKEINILKQQIDKLDGKIQFYVQEIKVLKSQAIALENLNKKQLLELENQKKLLTQNQDEVREQFYREKIDNMKIQLDKCNKENQQWQLINDQLLKEIKNLDSNKTYLQEEKELIQNELHNLKKKYESLSQEIELNQVKEKSETASISDNEPSLNKQQDINNIEEVKRLKTTVINLENTLKSLKSDYEQDMLKITNKSFLKSNSSQEIQLLQRLANSLAESLSDKEQALQTQRNINREILIKLQELQK